MIHPDFTLPLSQNKKYSKKFIKNSNITYIDFRGLVNRKEVRDEYKPMGRKCVMSTSQWEGSA